MEECKNTDKQIWVKEGKEIDEGYLPSIHVTEDGNIGISVGGTTIVMPVEKWHSLAVGDKDYGLIRLIASMSIHIMSDIKVGWKEPPGLVKSLETVSKEFGYELLSVTHASPPINQGVLYYQIETACRVNEIKTSLENLEAIVEKLKCKIGKIDLRMDVNSITTYDKLVNK